MDTTESPHHKTHYSTLRISRWDDATVPLEGGFAKGENPLRGITRLGILLTGIHVQPDYHSV